MFYRPPRVSAQQSCVALRVVMVCRFASQMAFHEEMSHEIGDDSAAFGGAGPRLLVWLQQYADKATDGKVISRQFPNSVLVEKAPGHGISVYLSEAELKHILDVICAECDESGVVSNRALDGNGPVNTSLFRLHTSDEKKDKFIDNIDKMEGGGAEGADTDQYRVFKFIIKHLEHAENPLRFPIHTSAGIGKSFLLMSVFLWAVLNGVNMKVYASNSVRHIQAGNN
jgi:hypothetical protein